MNGTSVVAAPFRSPLIPTLVAETNTAFAFHLVAALIALDPVLALRTLLKLRTLHKLHKLLIILAESVSDSVFSTRLPMVEGGPAS